MAPKNVKRIVEKDGRVNIQIPLKNSHLLTDPVGTVAKWNFLEHLVVLIICCVVPWLIFAFIWHFTFWLHGDLEPENLPDKQEDSDWTPCVFAIHSFTSSLLFSLETQRSIGYGLRGTSHKCTDSVILEMFQSICAILIECVIGVILYIKLTRGLSSSKTFLFSHNAVVSLRNGQLRLMFRVVNIKTQNLETHYSGHIVQKVTTIEGEEINHHFTRIHLSSQVDEEKNNLYNLANPVLPDTVSHTMDSTSPLYNISPDNIMDTDMELIVSIVVVEPNGSKTMFMTSYLPEEIVWAKHFAQCVFYKEEEGIFIVEVERINMMIHNYTPRMSSKYMDENKAETAQHLLMKKETDDTSLDLSFNAQIL